MIVIFVLLMSRGGELPDHLLAYTRLSDCEQVKTQVLSLYKKSTAQCVRTTLQSEPHA